MSLEQTSSVSVAVTSNVVVELGPEFATLASVIVNSKPSGSSQCFTLPDNSTIVQRHDQAWTLPYPPVVRSGSAHPHDRPYLEYGLKDRAALRAEFALRLPSKADQVSLNSAKNCKDRIETATFAVSCWSAMSKGDVLDGILRRFGKSNVKYACVANERDENDPIPRLHIQIILNKRINTTKSILADCLDVGCEYQVTKRDLVWNEYCKKGLDFVEFQYFVSTSQRAKAIQWPSGRNGAGKRTEMTEEEADEVYEKATDSVNGALLHIVTKRKVSSMKSLLSYRPALQFYHDQRSKEKQRETVLDKDFCWPMSFPNCTPKLRDTMEFWIRNYFKKTGRPKCLILIGPTGTGKTTFALSLPGVPNHIRGCWDAKSWSDEADYIITDDIPWDKFKERGFPSRRDLLTGQNQMTVPLPNKHSMKIHPQMPAVVLLNPDQAGSLLNSTPVDGVISHDKYWSQRAYVYIMGDDEYFYRETIGNLPLTSDAVKPPHIVKIESFQRRWIERQKEKARASAKTDEPMDERNESLTSSSSADDVSDDDQSIGRPTLEETQIPNSKTRKKKRFNPPSPRRLRSPNKRTPSKNPYR